MKAILLCAGYATRLYPLTLNTSKPLLEVKGKPLIEYTIEKIQAPKEVDKIYVVTNEKFYNQYRAWNKSEKVKIINDKTDSNETRLGGIGDLNFVIEKEKINDDILVVVGDIFFDFELKDFAQQTNTALGVYDFPDEKKLKNFGVVALKNNKIISFEEKPAKPKSNFIAAGIYLFKKSDVKEIKEYMKTSKPKEGPSYLIIDWMKSRDIDGFVFKGDWKDIGTIEAYEEIK